MQHYNSIAGAGKALAEAGFSVFPLHGVDENGRCTCGKPPGKKPCSGKHPLNLNWQAEATNDPEKAEALFESARILNPNIGIATGSERGVFVVDCDSPEALEFVSKFGLPKTPTAKTGNGRHFYFRYPNGVRIGPSQGKVFPNVDIRGDGGLIVAPPSKHYSGRSYEWELSPDEVPLADAPHELVFAILRTGEVQKPGTAVPVPTIRERTFTVGESQTIDRLRKYLEKVDPAISGEGGHDHAFGTVCKIVRNFGSELSDEAIIIGLQSWNERCVPPWSTSELRHKIADARKANPEIREPDAKVGTDYGLDRPIVQSSSEASQTIDSDEFPTLRPEAYYGLVGEFVRAIDDETEAPPEGILLALLTMFGNAIGKGSFAIAEGDTHHANLFACLVAGTGQGKGTTIGICDRLMMRVDSDWRSDCRCFGLSTGEGLIDRLADPEPSAKGIVIPPEKRLLCIENELSRPLTAMRREGNTLSAVLRNGWDSQPLEVLTKNPRRASNHHLSVLASITPPELREFTKKGTETTNGFANRFLWASLQSEKMRPFADSRPIIESFVERFREALERAKTIGELRRSDEANNHWLSVYARLKRALSPTTDRARSQVLRLSMIFALIDGTNLIGVDHQMAALAVWDFCESSALRLFGGTDDEDDERDNSLDSKILSVVRKRSPIKRSDLCNAVSKKIKAKEFDEAFLRLETANRIRCELERTGRKATQLFWSVGNDSPGSSPGLPPFAGGTLDTLKPRETWGQTLLTEGCSPLPLFPQGKRGTEGETASFVELLEWKNANGAEFVRREDGVIWLVRETGLTPALRKAIEANQEHLAGFVPTTTTTTTATPPEAEEIPEEEFYATMRSFLKPEDELRNPSHRLNDDGISAIEGWKA